MLRASLNDAAARRYIKQVPKFHIRLSDAPARNEYLSLPQVERLLRQCDVDHLARNCRTTKYQHFPDRSHLEGFILLAVTTAARKQAILDLRWRDVHLDASEHGPASPMDRIAANAWIDFGAARGRKRRPRISISHNPRLTSWLALRYRKASPEDHVLTYRGKPISNLKKGLDTLYKEAGIARPLAPAHIFKHTAITWMIQAEVPLSSIAVITNTSEVMLKRVYGHHSPDFQSQLSKVRLPS